MIKCGRPTKGREQVSRDRVLDSALLLFLEHGYGDLSMETVAKNARVSMRTIYANFGNKAGLFGAVVRRCSDQFVDCLSEEDPPREALIVFGIRLIDRITREDAVRLRKILIAESSRFPELAAQFYSQGPQRTLDRLTEYFASKQKQGFFSDFEPHLLADHFLSCLRSEHFQKLQLGLESPPELTEIEVWVKHTVDLFLYGSLMKRPG